MIDGKKIEPLMIIPVAFEWILIGDFHFGHSAFNGAFINYK